ncbi:MAG: RNA polymerase sigma factor [Cellulosilyticaceae bacterium]
MEIEKLIYEHKDRLYRLCLYLEKNKDRAEELFQDTWVKAIEKWDTYGQERDFYPWLTQIAVNRYRDKLRKLRRELARFTQLDQEVLYASEEAESVEDSFLKEEAMGQLLTQLKDLPDKYKLPLVLVFAEGLSYKDTAEMLGIEEKLVKSRVYDGRQKLKKLLSEEGTYE